MRPEFIVPQDGQDKPDCEIAAAKRWLKANAARYASGNDTLLGADIYAHQPFCRQTLLHGLHFIFTCLPSSHTHLAAWVKGPAQTGRLATQKLRVKGQGKRWEHHEYRWANGLPLVDSDDALEVNIRTKTRNQFSRKMLIRPCQIGAASPSPHSCGMTVNGIHRVVNGL